MMRTFTAALYGFLLTASLVAVPAASAGSLSASPFRRGFGAIGHHFVGCEGTIACRRAEASAETSANCIERPRDWRLAVEGGTAVPLLVVKPELRRQLASEPVQGKRAFVVGRYYHTSNTLLLAAVTALR